MYQTGIDTRHLPPDLQELVDTIISGVVALASRTNSNSDSNSLGGILFYFKRESEEIVARKEARGYS